LLRIGDEVLNSESVDDLETIKSITNIGLDDQMKQINKEVLGGHKTTYDLGDGVSETVSDNSMKQRGSSKSRRTRPPNMYKNAEMEFDRENGNGPERSRDRTSDE